MERRDTTGWRELWRAWFDVGVGSEAGTGAATLPLPSFGSSSWLIYSGSAWPKNKSPGTGKVSNGAISVFSPPAISWPMQPPATNGAKQEKPTKAAVGSDSYAERGNRAVKAHAKERENE